MERINERECVTSERKERKGARRAGETSVGTKRRSSHDVPLGHADYTELKTRPKKTQKKT